MNLELIDKPQIEHCISEMEIALQRRCAKDDLPYIRPEPTLRTYVLLNHSFLVFLELYMIEVRRACRNSLPFVEIA